MAGTITISHSQTRTMQKLSWSWTSDASGDASGTDTNAVSGLIYAVAFVPGSVGTQPSDLYDAQIQDADGIDILGGLGLNLPNSVTRRVVSGQQIYVYDTTDRELYKTDSYGGSDADLDTTMRYTSDIDLTFNTGAVVDFKFDGSGATDDFVLYLYKRRDANWDGDEIAGWSGMISSDGSEDIYHFTIDETYGAGHFRFGMKSGGGTDTFDIDVEARLYRAGSFSAIPVDGALSLVVANAGNAKTGTVIAYLR